MQIQTLNATEILTRDEDIAYIMECIADVECCSIVGVSNMGKSVLLRSVCRPEVKQRYLGPQLVSIRPSVYSTDGWEPNRFSAHASGRLAESIRTRLDKASARGEIAASRLDAQMDEVLERATIDAQLAERKKRLGME